MAEISYSEHLPHPALREAISCYWSLRSDGATAKITEPRRILPDGCVDIIFNFGDPLRRVLDRRVSLNRMPWYVVGAMTRPIEVQTMGHVDILGVRLRPGYANALLGIPASALTDMSPPLEDAWGKPGVSLGEGLAEARTLPSRISFLDQYLSDRYRNAEAPRGAVRLATSMLLESGGQAKISDVAARCGISSRHLGRQFEEAVGLSPKLFARIIRFQKVLAETKGATCPDWLTSVVEAGFHDQSHMIRDFREFAHCSPARLKTPA